MTSRIEEKINRLFKHLLYIVSVAIVYFYCAKSVGHFQVYLISYLSLDQVRIFGGLALVGALSVFDRPLRVFVALALGEFLVQWKLGTPPAWWLIGVYPLFLVPLFFLRFNENAENRGEFARNLGMFAAFGILCGIGGFFLLGFSVGLSFLNLYPQAIMFGISSGLFFAPLLFGLAFLFIWIRRPREMYVTFLTHHAPEDADHTITIEFGGLKVALCTRCSGMVGGVLIMLVLSDLAVLSIPSSTALLLCIILPAPGLFIWTGQKFGLWKDKTPSRLFNGALLGSSLFFITKAVVLYVEMMVVLVVYFSLFYAAYFGGPIYMRKKASQVLEEPARQESPEQPAPSDESKSPPVT